MARQTLTPNCPQCGGPVKVPEGATYVRCDHCSSQSFVDLSGALLNQVLRPEIRPNRAPGVVKARATQVGWPDAAVHDLTLVYEPVWEVESAGGRRLCVSARPGPQGRIAQIRLPGGSRAFVDPGDRQGTAKWIEPELAPESLGEVAARAVGQPVAIKTVRLIHRPVYRGEVSVAGSRCGVQLDAVTGEVIAADWPLGLSYRRRNRAWAATSAMILGAIIFPLPTAVAVTVVIASLAVGIFSRPQTEPNPPTP